MKSKYTYVGAGTGEGTTTRTPNIHWRQQAKALESTTKAYAEGQAHRSVWETMTARALSKFAAVSSAERTSDE
jgi:hypothetical protein